MNFGLSYWAKALCLGFLVHLNCISVAAHERHNTAPKAKNGIQISSLALVMQPTTVECHLENGASSNCLQVKVRHKPADLATGPFCPETIDATGGIWNWMGHDAGLYRVDKAFLEMIAAQGYKMFDAVGDVYISDISRAAPIEQHTCIQVSEDKTVEITALIPLDPILANHPTELGIVDKIGIAVNGSPIFSDAPSVSHTGHMPALDTCGGHVDPGGWYHWHANARDIDSVFEAHDVTAECHIQQDATALFGYAFDGFPIYGSLESNGQSPQDLDRCGGHVGEMPNDEIGYRYHTSLEFPNLPACLSGVPAKGNFETTAQVGVGANPPEGLEITRRNPPRGRSHSPPNLREAALNLGIPEQDLRLALRESGRPPNLAIAAESLNISEEALFEALPRRPRR